MLEINVNREENMVAIFMKGVLDISTVDDFKETVLGLQKRQEFQDVKNLVFDFSQLKFIDSTGMGALATVIRKIGDRKCIRVINIPPDIYEVFEILGVMEIFDNCNFEPMPQEASNS